MIYIRKIKLYKKIKKLKLTEHLTYKNLLKKLITKLSRGKQC